ncbi:MAG: peptide-methionine (S)-S-oxide reductase [Colwellia sp.]|jgi:peptide-methionine (S)-S-oxide reductase
MDQDQLFDYPIVTQISRAVNFHSGEDYHQGYFKNNPEN